MVEHWDVHWVAPRAELTAANTVVQMVGSMDTMTVEKLVILTAVRKVAMMAKMTAAQLVSQLVQK